MHGTIPGHDVASAGARRHALPLCGDMASVRAGAFGIALDARKTALPGRGTTSLTLRACFDGQASTGRYGIATCICVRSAIWPSSTGPSASRPVKPTLVGTESRA